MNSNFDIFSKKQFCCNWIGKTQGNIDNRRARNWTRRFILKKIYFKEKKKKKFVSSRTLSHSKGERNFAACVISLENSAR